MTNKKALNILSSHIELDMGSDEWYEVKEAYKVLEQDLEKLEQYEKIFNTPLIEIRKQLEILNMIKRYYRFNQNINEDLLVLKKPITYEDSEIIKEWIEIDKNKDLYKDMFYKGED